MDLDKIIQHDVAKPFPLPDESIDCAITSPPYWGLRDYGKEVKSIFGGDPKCKHVFTEQHSKLAHENRQNLDGGTIGNAEFRENLHGFGNAKAGFCQKCGAWFGQLGLEPHPQMYIDHLVMICREIKRVLKKSGSFYLNLGDTYYSAGAGHKDVESLKRSAKNYRCGNLHESNLSASHQRVIKNDGHWCQPKQLLLIPSRVAVALQDDGWVLRNDIIWHKPNPMPSSVKDRLNTTFEHVFHFVKQKRYFYDLDAIREPHKTESITRYQHSMDGCFTPGRAYPNEEREKPQKWKLSNGGKNPGDAFEYNVNEDEPQGNVAIKQRMAYRRRVLGMDHDHCLDHPKGRNPGDVITAKYKGQDVNPSEGHIRRGKELHDAFPPGYTGHPSGKNPGDVVKHDIAIGRVGSFSYNDPLHAKPYDPKGKNPGDVLQFDEEYWWNFILGRAHSNRFYKKAYEIMKEWMVENNCFDYNIFYEWYRKEFKGMWESGNLEKGKANYLSDVKRLPFPKPETRFLGDIPGDFWSITTQPFTGYNPDLEHFAVFPEALILKPLKSSCPRWVCKKCGKPQKKVVKSGGYDEAFNIRVRDVKEGRIKHTDRKASEKEVENYDEGEYVSKVKNHVISPGCNCNAGFRPGVVLDPFCGRGTVGKVAKRLGLHYILFDIKPEYCELAHLFIGGQKYKIPKGQSSLDVFGYV